VYKAWKGNNVSEMPLSSLFPSAPFSLPKFLGRGCGVDLCGLEVATQINCPFLSRDRH
jgi:hypothetical protein